MMTNVTNLPDSQLDYWARIALLDALVNDARAMNTFDDEDEYKNDDIDLDQEVMVDYADDIAPDEYEKEPVEAMPEQPAVINKSFFSRFKKSAASIYDKSPQIELVKSGDLNVGLKKRPIC